ncbi:MAG: hypothetical protein GXO55_04400 [Chloroflexi bacterium]|nr:hypothetical protein [Chloroflexota bacterium]
MTTALHVFLAPRLGDAVLACGGTMAYLTRRGADVYVAVPFIPNHASPESPEIRETRNAWELLHVKGWLGLYPIAEERQHPLEKRNLYTHRRALYGLPDPSEGDLPHRLAGEITTLFFTRPTFIYAPLALNRHVDHIHLASAGHVLAREGYRVLWYEEYPRVVMPDTLRTLKRRGWHPLLIPLHSADTAAKIQAVHHLHSRIPHIFGHPREIARRIVDDLWTLSGQGYMAERFWERVRGGAL